MKQNKVFVLNKAKRTFESGEGNLRQVTDIVENVIPLVRIRTWHSKRHVSCHGHREGRFASRRGRHLFAAHNVSFEFHETVWIQSRFICFVFLS